MKTETENLRELDEWIAEHVMGWRVFTSGRGSVCCEVEGGGIRIIDARHPWETSDFSPTADPAAAMQVLTKCAEKEGKENFDGVQIDKIESGWIVSTCKIDAGAETLPLAICKFAKALYSK